MIHCSIYTMRTKISSCVSLFRLVKTWFISTNNSSRAGHAANIFSAYFMPNTSDHIIISAAGDSQVRIFDCSKEAALTNMYVCHEDQVRRLAVFKNNPNEFLSCSQDGTVRHFDLRKPHHCSNQSVRSFITSLRVPVRQTIKPNGRNVQRRCPEPIIDYRDNNTYLNTLSINQLNQNYFAVAGQSEYIYLHDRRMLSKVECVNKFTSTGDVFKRKDKQVTAVKFSDYNGYELLGSWSSNGVYLFNINSSPLERLVSRPTYESLTEVRSEKSHLPLRTSRQHKDEYIRRRKMRRKEWDSLMEIFKSQDYTEIIRASKRLLHHAVRDHLQLIRCSKDKIPFRNTLIDECGLFQVGALVLSALARIRKLMAESFVITDYNVSLIRFSFRTLEDFSDHEFLLAKEELTQAKRLVPATWKGDFGLAIGYYYAGCLLLSFNYCTHRNLFVHQARSRQYRAYRAFKDSVSMTDLKESRMEYLSELRNRVITLSRVAATSNSLSQPLEVPWDYLNHIVMDTDNDIDMSHNEGRINQDITMSLTSFTPELDSFENDEDDEMINTNGEYELMDAEEFLAIAPSEFSVPSLPLFYSNEHHFSTDNLEHDTNIIPHKMKYTGHRNIETIKEVDFFGQSDEYVVSGSDDGLLFIWDKNTGKTVQVLRADDEVVNVTKGHPRLPILAVSGIDSTIKIITPKAEPFSTSRYSDPDLHTSYSPSSQMYDLDQIVTKNQRLRGLEGQNDIDYLSNINETSHLITALGIKLEESSLRDYQDIE
ncbi:unnamed protein product [Rhizopus stolonifer]